ncbi:MAG: tripartite tricarboxylate transporter substrate binding protein [Rhodocyclaceae bacterium]|jgi:tripartite-type tricarboxylate transporter receptor subunit TctC|nr:tripartite tricarboxylate transporter substrate binding protein [Rhodocyclaceae bacterium]MCA3089927.1 tripartite tricarboxylate transporter substrate binding protein [Rhodocyclaceae bacterium]MCA3093575.1 tripartite tricarboxylate transporter substrate binding protein [Rhodocyclaceae bacterium]MCA3096392.1 tripartite tricarboxylate transporter substrate binding protein [Rhodocyclaceae bacterium]MCA3101161.1 tripartite tricarboxylate transporter substrate binding protein [Rhodocyclaceae bact
MKRSVPMREDSPIVRFRVARVLAAVFLATAAGGAFSQSWPAKPVRLILPYGPGGGSDVVARPLGHHLSQRLGQQFLVDNRGGANGNIAMEMVARAPADGYTLGLALTAQLAINPFLYTKIPYDPVKDFTPVTLLGSAPYFLSVSKGTPANTVEEFLRLARAKPGAMTYGSTGNGSGLHLSMELLKTMTGIDIVHAPYKSAGAAMTDMLGEQLQAMFVSYGAGVGHFKAGRVRPLGATTVQRSKALPEVPTIAEAGVKGYESSVWYALLAPRGTPPEIVRRLHTEIVSLLKGELGAQFEADGITPSGAGPEQLAAFVRSESQKWGKVVKQSGAKLD